MTLAAGSRLGPYEIVRPIGEGGMGVVYRAHDARLGRDVALKTLPPEAAAGAEQLARFEQEARAAGALNHPNILVVYDVGEHEGSPFVVYELLEGRTLRQELANGPLPVRKAIDYAGQVAAGLAAAHSRGIVHRDLKPENLIVTRDGHVKILDFGIAKLLERPGIAGGTATATAGGAIFGTPGYMSPEQVTGERVDHRSDVFSLGCVLYEMLAGDRAFKRSTAVETLNAILTSEPPDITPTGAISPALDRVVRHCLEKDPAARFQSARDVAFALEGLSSPSGPYVMAAGNPVTSRSFVRSWGLAIGALAVLAAIAFASSRSRVGETSAGRPVRFPVTAPDDGAFQGILGVSSAISPDGQHLVMAVTTGAGTRLFLRNLNSTQSVMIEGTEGAQNPFWSPDSRNIGFAAATKLKTVAIAGGAPKTICDIKPGPWVTGTWGAHNRIVFSSGYASGPGSTLLQVVDGQRPEPAVDVQSGFLAWPHFLPDGEHYLYYFVDGKPGDDEIRLATVGKKETTLLLRANSRAVYAEPGFLLYVREGTLYAHPFDATTLHTTGDPFPVAEHLLYFRDLGQADFSASQNGVIAYSAGPTPSRLVWMNRGGTELGQLGKPDDYWFLDLSPDDKKVAVDVLDRRAGTTDIVVFDVERSAEPTRFTFDPIIDWTPTFSPDSSRLAFASARRGSPHLHVKALTDSGPGEMLMEPTGPVHFTSDWARTPRGEVILFSNPTPGSFEIWSRPMTGDTTPRPLVRSAQPVSDGRVSPDGRWLAYVSLEGGRNDVYVRALEGSDERWKVSTAGGVNPRWTRGGRELIYLGTESTVLFGSTVTDGRLMSVDVAPGAAFKPGVPKVLFPVIARSSQYDVTSNGERFLVNLGLGSGALPITVAVDWLKGIGR